MMLSQGGLLGRGGGGGGKSWPIILPPATLIYPSTFALMIVSAMTAFGIQVFRKKRGKLLQNVKGYWHRRYGHMPHAAPPFGYAVRYPLAWIYRKSDEWLGGLNAIRVMPEQGQCLPLREALEEGGANEKNPLVIYCLDLTNQLVVFVELDKDADLLSYPFMDRGVRRLAGDAVIVTSVESAKAHVAMTLMERRSKTKKGKADIPSSEPSDPMGETIWVWNTGRCGSTLFHRMLLAAGINSLSEPFWLEQLCRSRHVLGDEQTKQLLRLCLTLDSHFMSRMYAPDATITSINPKGIGHYLLDLAHGEFPTAKHIFLYRNVIPVVESLGSCLYSQSSLMTRLLLAFKPRSVLHLPDFRSKHLREWLAQGELTISGRAGEGLAMGLALNWLDAVCTWLEVTECWKLGEAAVLRMEEFVDPLRREEVVAAILRRLLGVNKFTCDTLERCLEVFGKHSQAGSRMEKHSSSATGDRFLTPRLEELLRDLMASVPDLHITSCCLPCGFINPVIN